MSIYDYEQAFGAADKTSRAMRQAIKEWFGLYYRTAPGDGYDPCQRIAYTVVTKLVKAVFGEYHASAPDPVTARMIAALDEKRAQAMGLALIGGECYIKPCLGPHGIGFRLISRDNVLIFGRDERGEPTDVGTLERSISGKYYYTLLERRRVDEKGYLTIENRLYRSLDSRNLGQQTGLREHPAYARLAEKYRYELPVGSVGLVQLKTPMVNCVDGSADGVSVYAAAAGLIRNIDRNEAQLCGEFDRGESRIIVSADMLDQESLRDHLFVGLDEDPERVGMTVFSPQLREQSFLARKQEYLRNVESVIGLKRGMLSDANMEDRTATEITASAAEYSLTVMDLQQMWQKGLRQAVRLCAVLCRLYGLEVPEQTDISIDWGNGVLYDEEKTWADYMEMVRQGLLKPEIALGWRFELPAGTREEQLAIRCKYMPEKEEV